MLVHSLAGDGRPDDVTSLFLPHLATFLNTSAITNASGVGGVVCDTGECNALDSFSLCLWVNVLLKMPASAVISYFISTYVHNALLIRLEDQRVTVGYMKDARSKAGLVSPRAWHLLCFVRSGSTTTFSLDHNTVLHINSFMPLLLNGSLILGNDQDKFDGGYTTTEAFVGEMAWVGMWDNTLTPQDLAALLRCRPAHQPTITAARLPWEMRGQVTTREGDPCLERDTPTRLLVAIPVPYGDAKYFCQKLGMSLPIPESAEASKQLATALKAHEGERCSTLYTTMGFLWLGAEYSPAKNRWVDGRSGAELCYVAPDIVASSMSTLSHVVLADTGMWISTVDYALHCFLCQGVLGGGPFLLRGLCRTPLYLYIRASPSGGIYWHGEARVSLLQRGDRWQLQDDLQGQVAAQLDHDMPLGRASWQVFNTTLCVDPIAFPTSTASLSLTQCSKGLFSCWAGGCVSMEARCSLTPDCQDASDERGCQLVHPKPGTRHHLPPHPHTITLDLSLRLLKVSLAGTNTKPGVLRVLVEARFRWRDERFIFHNLQKEMDLNVVDPTLSVWRPLLQVVDEARLAGSVPPLTKLLISRDAEGFDTGFDMVFEGSENRLELMMEMALHVSCPFRLGRYPFDEQACDVTFLLANLPEKYARYSPHVFVQTCPCNTMVEFVLDECVLHLQNGSNVVRLSMKLRRRWSYHLWATYVPTVLLHVVGYETLIVPAKDIQSRVMLSLLALLTLVALYSDTLAALPYCSYLRLLDVWLLFSVAFPASVIAVHIAGSDPDEPGAHLVLRRGRVVLGVLYCVFVSAYIILLVATR